MRLFIKLRDLPIAGAVLLALSLAFLAAGTAHAGPGLVFTIELDKSSFVLYEPVTVQCRLANPTPSAIQTFGLFGTDPGGIRVSIIRPDGTIQEHRHLWTDDRALIGIRQEPGSVQAVEVNLHWNAATSDWTFPTPGTYRIVATVWAGIGQEGASLESNTVEIKIKKPKAVDARAIAFFATNDEFLSLLREGTFNYCRRKTDHECLVELNEFLRRFHDSVYAPNLVWELWGRSGPGLTGFDRSEYKLFWSFERFLKEWPRASSAPRAMYRLGMCLAVSQRFEQAREVVDRLARSFPREEILARHLSENVEWCAAGFKTPLGLSKADKH